jgi:hypothetical protein
VQCRDRSAGSILIAGPTSAFPLFGGFPGHAVATCCPVAPCGQCSEGRRGQAGPSRAALCRLRVLGVQSFLCSVSGPLRAADLGTCASMVRGIAASLATEASLEARAADLGVRGGQLRAELKALSAAARKRALPEASKKCTPWMKAVSLRVFAASEFQAEAALRYLQSKGRAATAEDLRAWYASLSPDEKARLLSPTADSLVANKQLAEALKFLAEFRLVLWVQEQNHTKGAAPTSKLILEHAPAGHVRSRSAKNRLRWVRRFMRRFGGRRARFAHGERLSQEDFRRKVGSAVQW